jgi:hypothetical protein
MGGKKEEGRERVGLTLGFSVQGCIECKIALHLLHVVFVYTPRPEFSSAMYVHSCSQNTPIYHSLNSVSPNSLQLSNLQASSPYAHKVRSEAVPHLHSSPKSK